MLVAVASLSSLLRSAVFSTPEETNIRKQTRTSQSSRLSAGQRRGREPVTSSAEHQRHHKSNGADGNTAQWPPYHMHSLSSLLPSHASLPHSTPAPYLVAKQNTRRCVPQIRLGGLHWPGCGPAEAYSHRPQLISSLHFPFGQKIPMQCNSRIC